jgi:hypothetical protein
VGAPNIIQQHASTSLNLRPDLPKATAIEEIGAPSIRFQQYALHQIAPPNRRLAARRGWKWVARGRRRRSLTDPSGDTKSTELLTFSFCPPAPLLLLAASRLEKPSKEMEIRRRRGLLR